MSFMRLIELATSRCSLSSLAVIIPFFFVVVFLAVLRFFSFLGLSSFFLYLWCWLLLLERWCFLNIGGGFNRCCWFSLLWYEYLSIRIKTWIWIIHLFNYLLDNLSRLLLLHYTLLLETRYSLLLLLGGLLQLLSCKCLCCLSLKSLGSNINSNLRLKVIIVILLVLSLSISFTRLLLFKARFFILLFILRSLDLLSSLGSSSLFFLKLKNTFLLFHFFLELFLKSYTWNTRLVWKLLLKRLLYLLVRLFLWRLFLKLFIIYF